MNPLTNVKNVLKLSEQELTRDLKTSWHDQYKGSAWVFVGGLPYDLTEGDIICIFSQYGEIVNLNLIRDQKTGKQKGFCFLCFEDQRSTVLAVDNLNGIKVLGKTLRVDHVADYKPPKDNDKYDDETKRLHTEGCAPVSQIPVQNIKRESTLQSHSRFNRDVKQELPPPPSNSQFPSTSMSSFKVPSSLKREFKDEPTDKEAKAKKSKKDKKQKKNKKEKRRRRSSDSSD